MRIKYLVISICLLSSSLLLAQARSDYRGVITRGPASELVSVAIEHFRMSGGFTVFDDSLLTLDMYRILRDDMQFSLLFNVVEPDSAFLADFVRGRMKLDDWIYLGAQMLISGRVEREGGGLLFTADVTDVYRNKIVYSHDFVGESKNYRYLMHRVAADILYTLTGEEGCYFSKIIFSCDSTGNSEIYSCDFDGYASAQLTHDRSIDIIPSWSIDGKQIYYTSYKNGNTDLFVLDLTLGKNQIFSARPGLNTGAAMSPDGKYIACTLSMGTDSEIYLVDASGKILKRLTFSEMIDTAPSWAPSSHEIAFTSDRTGLPQIYITDTDGLNTRRLTFQGEYNDQASWSPRGDLIAYSSRERDGFQIYSVDITGQYPQKLTDVGSNESPSWSPDGLHLIYTSNASGQNKLMVMDFNGLNKRQLDVPGNCKTPEWSRNIK